VTIEIEHRRGAGLPGSGTTPEPRREAPPRAGALVLHPGRFQAGGRWPAARFAALVRMGHAGRDVVVLAGPGDLDVAVEVAARADLDPSRVHGAQASLLELVPVMRRAACVVSADTGVIRLAVALDIPALLLWGGQVAPWRPPSRARVRTLLAPQVAYGHAGPAAGAGGRDPGAGHDGRNEAPDEPLLGITVSAVLAELERVTTRT
jgi:ADP-heptose:LPS heptosyltransferase